MKRKSGIDVPRVVTGDVVGQKQKPQREIAKTENITVELAAEQLIATTQPFERGVVHLHKGVEEVEQHLVVPLAQEQAIIERIPAAQFDRSRPVDPDEIIIPITEERLVLHREVVVTEYIRVRKQRTMRNEEVRETVRREVLTVQPEDETDDADALPLVKMAEVTAERGTMS